MVNHDGITSHSFLHSLSLILRLARGSLFADNRIRPLCIYDDSSNARNALRCHFQSVTRFPIEKNAKVEPQGKQVNLYRRQK